MLIFAFFMMSDPRTVPTHPRARRWFGAATAAVAAVLIAPHTSEYGVKLALLASLTLTCAVAPWFDPDPNGGRRTALRAGWWHDPDRIAVLVAAAGAAVGTLILAGDDRLVLIERGLTTAAVQ